MIHLKEIMGIGQMMLLKTNIGKLNEKIKQDIWMDTKNRLG